MSWGSGQPVARYAEPAPVTPMPAEAIEPEPETELPQRKSPGDPKCDDCALSETGTCGQHLGYHASYDPVRSVGIERPTHEQRLDRTFKPVV